MPRSSNIVRFTAWIVVSLAAFVLAAAPAAACVHSPPALDIWIDIEVCEVGGVQVTWARVTFHGYATFGTTNPTFCMCGLSKVGGIRGVTAARLLDATSGIPLAEFDFQLSSKATASAAALLAGADVQGFLADVQSMVAADVDVDLQFDVVLEDGTTTAALEAALLASGGPTVVTGKADDMANLLGHVGLLPRCALQEDFESSLPPGWGNSGSSTCSTGDFVVGDPTNPGGGVQIVGSHSGANSIFTALNTSAGVDDVDGGNCVLDSPLWAIGAPADLSVWFWHGQRDAGDDVVGDFFRLEYSIDAGMSWQTLASNGDAASTPTWTEASAAIPAGSSVALRVQCSDGTATGDLVECGIDDVSICSQ